LLIAAALMSASAMAGIVGSGTPSSCTEAALQAQLAAGGTVTFNYGAGQQTIAMPNTMVFGQTNPKTIIDGNDTITLDGTGNTSGMIIIFGSSTALPDVTMRHLTIANGNITTGLNAGGAIQNFGKLTLDTVTLRNSRADGSGAIFQEPCTGCLTPTLTASHCTFQNNSNTAISVEGGIATIADSTFTGNSSRLGSGIDIYSNSTFTVTMPVERCTFENNTSVFGGGAIAVELLNTGSSVVIANDTFTGNTATDPSSQGSALYLGASPVTISNCMIAGNTAPSGRGAIYFNTFTPVAVMNNAIIASNTGGTVRSLPAASSPAAIISSSAIRPAPESQLPIRSSPLSPTMAGPQERWPSVPAVRPLTPATAASPPPPTSAATSAPTATATAP
jgi:predicted outer membrane repeat protein